ncbi:MAG: helix-turn-helix domain-containing protein [Candidatus Limnocylindrales bacterium]
MSKLLNIDQAAERLGTSPRFVRRLVAERRLTFVRVGRYVRIEPADLDAFIDAGQVEPFVVPVRYHSVGGPRMRNRR